MVDRLGKSFILSPHFRFILESWPSAEFLLLLRDNWLHYSRWIIPTPPEENDSIRDDSRTALKAVLSAVTVRCLDGLMRRLSETFLPAKHLGPALLEVLPLLDIPDAESLSWLFLENLGVTAKEDVRGYLLCLKNIRGKDEISRVDVLHLYKRIQSTHTDHPDLIR